MKKKYNMSQLLAFDPVLPWNGIQEGVIEENGKKYLQLYLPAAEEVSFIYSEKEYKGEKNKNGVWNWKLPFDTAVNYIQLVVDGTPMLSPVLPIGYGYSRPYNFVVLDRTDEDYYALKDVPHGSVRKEYYFSSVINEWQSCMVYTPPCYEENREDYPVLYLQHGHGENENGWSSAGRVNFILDNLIAEKKAVPFIVVMCNGMVQKEQENGERVVDFTLFEEELLQDVIPFIEKHYRAKKDKLFRGMAGLSMGSLQTCMITFNHSEMFAYVGLFSGFMSDFIQGSPLDMVKREKGNNEHLRFLENREKFKNSFRLFFRAMGEDDIFMEYFLKDDQLCEKKGISCIRRLYKGAHDWNVWRRCIYDFSQLIFKQEFENGI